MSRLGRPIFRRIQGWPLVLLLLLLAIGGSLAARGALAPPAVRIGFVATLTGRNADLGRAGHDGAELAVEECNEAGGINGAAVQLLVRDDRGLPSAYLTLLNELERAGVAAVVGPMTSTTALAAAEAARDQGFLLVSPSASGITLGRRDDRFFRIYPNDAELMEHLARYLRQSRKYRTVALVLDTTNPVHTSGAAEVFGASFTSLGGIIGGELEFASAAGTPFSTLAQQAIATRPDCILVLANACDTALFCQQLRKLGSTVPVTTGEWAGTDELLTHGGRAVEGCFLFNTFDANHPGQRYRAFRQRFQARFGYEPGFAAVHAYDSTRIVLMAAASQDYRTREDLKRVLLTIRSFEGLQGRISFDDYGDVRRELFLSCVRDGAFHGVQ